MRKHIVAANWKMNLLISEGERLVQEILKEPIELKYNQNVIFCPPFTHLTSIAKLLNDSGKTKFYLGAQNCAIQDSGAFTGEISISMLKDIGVRYVIVGHSERRQLFGESNELIKQKIDALLTNQITPIFCCGEPLDVREKNNQNEFVEKQLEESIFHLKGAVLANEIIIAYEPIWAIGTGKTATTDQAEEMHLHIRKLIETKFDIEVANDVSILYGGSCKAENALELFANENVDGGLIGGAALEAHTFLPIIKALN